MYLISGTLDPQLLSLGSNKWYDMYRLCEEGKSLRE